MSEIQNMRNVDTYQTEQQNETPSNWVDYAEDRKIYVSSLNFATRNDSLKVYFEKFGEVEKAEVKMENANRSRGFGFVIFYDPEVINSLLELKHTLDGREIEVKRAITMKEKFSTNKLFVGGLPNKLTNDQVVQFFEKFGEVQDIEWVVDRMTGNRKGFCFVIFDDSDAVEKVTEGKVPPQSQKHDINGYTVECKKKFPDNHPVQKKIKRIQQQKKDRAMAQDYMAYGQSEFYNGPTYYEETGPGYGYFGTYGYGAVPANCYETYGVQYNRQQFRPIPPVSN